MSAKRSPPDAPIDDEVASQSLRTSHRHNGRTKAADRGQEGTPSSQKRVDRRSSPLNTEPSQPSSAKPKQSRRQQARRSELASKSAQANQDDMPPTVPTLKSKKRSSEKVLNVESDSASADVLISQTQASTNRPKPSASGTGSKRPADTQAHGSAQKKPNLGISTSSSASPPLEPKTSPLRSTFFEKLQERAWSDPSLRHKLGKVVQRAERRAISVGNECLAQAIRKTFNDAGGDTSLLAALGAIINRRASNGQIEAFQLHIRDSKASLRNQARDRETTRLRSIKEAAAIIQSRKSEQNARSLQTASGISNGHDEAPDSRVEGESIESLAGYNENTIQKSKLPAQTPQQEPEGGVGTPKSARPIGRPRLREAGDMASTKSGKGSAIEGSGSRRTRRLSSLKQLEAEDVLTATPTVRQSGRARATRNSQPTLQSKSKQPEILETPRRPGRQHSMSSVSSLSSVGSAKQDPLELAAIEHNHLPVPPSAMNAMANGNINQDAYPHNYKAAFKQSKAKNFKGNSKRPAEENNSAEHEAKRQRLLRNSFEGYHVAESNIRPATIPVPDPELQALPAPRSRIPQSEAIFGAYAEREDSPLSAVSSISGDLLVPPPPGALRSSKAATNDQSIRGQRGPRPGRSARMKVSPKKKTLGPVAGMASRVMQKDVPYISKMGSFENVDICETCGGGGSLLCCDGCPRAFHVKCVDPPIDDAPEGQWYCQVCRYQRSEPYGIPDGDDLFSRAQNEVTNANPRAFYLPFQMREFYDAVNTGDEGQYEELLALSRARARPFAGLNDDKDDMHHPRTVKATGQIILCHRCGQSSSKTRDLVVCDFNEADAWHLDCLDPPLANPPVKWSSDGTKLKWKCPLHDTVDAKTATRGARPRKGRRAKKIKTVRPAFGRGLQGADQVEIQNDESDIEIDGQSLDEYGLVYHLHEKNIKLDFFDRIRKEKEAQLHNQKLRNRSMELSDIQRQIKVAKKQKDLLEFQSHTRRERAAALALADLAASDEKRNFSEMQIENAVVRLLADAKAKKDAGTNVGNEIETLEMSSTPPVASLETSGILDRETLLYLDSLIKARLAAL